MDIQKPFVFISYHTSSTASFVKELSEELEHLGIEHWYSERDMEPMSNYAEIIPHIIEQSSLVLILLNAKSNISKQVENEFLKAYDLSKPIFVVKIDDCVEARHFSFIKSSVQFFMLNGMNRTIAIQNICYKVNEFFTSNTDFIEDDTTVKEVFDTSRSDTKMEFFGYEEERKRIDLQRQFIFNFAKDVYDKTIKEKKLPAVLDVGCSTGEQFAMYAGNFEQISLYIGIDREKKALEYGKKIFNNPKIEFYEVNLESANLDSILSDIEYKHGIDGFDIINLSMILLHVQKPRKLLDTLKNHLSDDGRMIILDIDDGFNIAYPDNQGIFQRAINICEYTNYSGYRKSGREIYSYLKEIDMKDIVLHKIGISTIGMNRKQRNQLFNIYFWFIYDDLRIMHDKHPKSTIIKSDLDWFQKVYDDMKLQFKKNDFFFNLGFVLFTANNE